MNIDERIKQLHNDILAMENKISLMEEFVTEMYEMLVEDDHANERLIGEKMLCIRAVVLGNLWQMEKMNNDRD